MARTGLDRLLRPRSISVIGGGVWGANVVEQCRKIGFAGPVWPVHPRKDSLGGVATVPRIEDLPEAPDACFIGINREGTIDVLRALSAMGAGGAVCFASGFAEAAAQDGRALQDALLAAAGDMAVLGPNCYGFINALDRAALWPDQHGAVPVARGVALITQSSNIAINLTMQDRALPLAYVLTAGNQAQTGLSALGRAVLEDDRVTALGLHIEGIDDLRGMEALAQDARRLGKPIVALKLGRSARARAATLSHTASLAGSDAGARALLRRLGIGQVTSLPALLETLKLLHALGPLPSNRVVSLSCSGGEASLIADAAEGRDVVFPPLSAQQETALRAVLGPRVALANPLDYHTDIWGDVPAMTAAFTAAMGPGLALGRGVQMGQGVAVTDPVALGCVVLDFPRPDRCDTAAWEPVLDAMVAAQKACGRPLAVLSTLTECMPEPVAQAIMARGLTPLSGVPEALEAIEQAAFIGQASPPADPLLLPAPTARQPSLLTESQAKAALAAHGLRVPRATTAITPEAAVQAAADMACPVAVKALGLAHKSEAGAVRLNLTAPEDVHAAARAMPSDHVLVEEMIPPGVELLLGVVADPAHGYVLTLAAGGVFTELLRDSASLLLPASRDDIRAALAKLALAPRLSGYRGAPGVDLDAVMDAVNAVQDYVATAHPAEVEINPLICGPHGAVAADALIRFGDTT